MKTIQTLADGYRAMQAIVSATVFVYIYRMLRNKNKNTLNKKQNDAQPRKKIAERIEICNEKSRKNF